MFKKKDIVRRIDDEDGDRYIVIKTNVPIITGYNVLGRAQYARSRKHMVIKPLNDPRFPGEITVIKSDYL
jgi:hypothetical protein